MAAAGEADRKNLIQVAATRPVAFYASLAKKLLLDNATVELSAIGQAMNNVVSVAEILSSSGLAAKSKIESSTIDSSRAEGAKAVQKRRLQIWITRGPKFEEHRAEIVASVASKAEGEAAKK